jgi:tRNA A37 threonylcarbamoyladenosine modification protein TsaB
MGLITLGTDQVGIYLSDTTIAIPRKKLELDFSSQMMQFIHGGMTTRYIITGPGSFTNLRIGTLILNTLQSFAHHALTFYTISKPDLYSYLYLTYDAPLHAVMYIGQKKNVWLYNNSALTHEVIAHNDKIPSKHIADPRLEQDVAYDQTSYMRNQSPHVLRHDLSYDIV